LVTNVVGVQRLAREGDSDGRNVTSGLDSVQTFFLRLPHIGDVCGINASDLVKASNSTLQDFSNSNSLVDGTAHSFQDDLRSRVFLILQQASCVRNVVSHFALSSDTNLVGRDLLILWLGLFNSSVLVHCAFKL